jgi:hypothetical protein
MIFPMIFPRKCLATPMIDPNTGQLTQKQTWLSRLLVIHQKASINYDPQGFPQLHHLRNRISDGLFTVESDREEVVTG